jgi:hypothetical protein
MTLSMVIQLFHKFILFRKGFGPTLTYFLVATTNMLEDDEEDGISLTPRFKSQRLVSEGEFNSTVLSAFPVDVYLILGFFVLRFIRKILRSRFYKWEEWHGRDIYETHWKLTNGHFKKQKNINFLIKPLLNKVKEESGYTKISDKEELDSGIPKSNLGFFRRLLIKLYGLTYLLEFVLICRFMDSIFIHTSFNLFRVNYAFEFSDINLNHPDVKGKKTKLYLIANLVISGLMLSILIFNLCRFIKRNIEFSFDDEKELKRLIAREKKAKEDAAKAKLQTQKGDEDSDDDAGSKSSEKDENDAKSDENA